jgi:hypothetical protein
MFREGAYTSTMVATLCTPSALWEFPSEGAYGGSIDGRFFTPTRIFKGFEFKHFSSFQLFKTIFVH